MRYRSKLSAACLAALAACGAGCEGCPGSKPYTPYTITDAPAVGSGGAPSDQSDGDAAPSPGAEDAAAPVPTFAAVQATPAPGDGATWEIEPSAVAKAPAGRAFTLGLVLDADGDGKRDLVAWAQAPDGLRGELRFSSGAKPEDGRTIAALPGDLSSQGCTSRASLAQVGPRSLALDFAPQCAAGRRATRWVALVRFGGQEGDAKGPELGLEIRAAAPPSGESIEIAVDGSDRDGDGRDDITAKVSLSGGLRPFSGAVGPYPSLPAMTAVVSFFDRKAGLSRDPSEPAASLAQAAAGLLADAKKKDTAATVAPAAHQLRRLRSILCEESGKALVTTSAGPIQCGDTRDIEEGAMAEATAAATRGDAARALLAIARLDARPALGDARKREIIKILGKVAPIAAFQLVHRAAAVPKLEAPGWGPLAFEQSGDLLIRTAEGVTRVYGATLTEAPADVAAWPSSLSSEGSGAAGDAWVLAGVEQRCDAPTLVALAEDAASPGAAGGDASERRTSIALPILTPVTARGLPSDGRCSPVLSVPVTPIAATSELGLVFSVGPDILGLKRQRGAAVVSLLSAPLDVAALGEVTRGSARSRDGASIAVPTSRGLLVMTGGTARLWSGAEMEQASSCTPQSGGGRVACVGGGAALIYEAR
jgi:hypothetical protein